MIVAASCYSTTTAAATAMSDAVTAVVLVHVAIMCAIASLVRHKQETWLCIGK